MLNKVLQGSKRFCIDVLIFMRFCKVLKDFIWFFQKSYTRFCKVLQVFARSCKVLQCSVNFCKVLQSSSRLYRARSCKMLYNVRFCKFLPAAKVIHTKYSKQFKYSLYFYMPGQSRPFWAVLKLL